MENEMKIIENTKSWTVKFEQGKVKISYNVPKEFCRDRKALDDYIKKELKR